MRPSQPRIKSRCRASREIRSTKTRSSSPANGLPQPANKPKSNRFTTTSSRSSASPAAPSLPLKSPSSAFAEPMVLSISSGRAGSSSSTKPPTPVLRPLRYRHSTTFRTSRPLAAATKSRAIFCSPTSNASPYTISSPTTNSISPSSAIAAFTAPSSPSRNSPIMSASSPSSLAIRSTPRSRRIRSTSRPSTSWPLSTTPSRPAAHLLRNWPTLTCCHASVEHQPVPHRRSRQSPHSVRAPAYRNSKDALGKQTKRRRSSHSQRGRAA